MLAEIKKHFFSFSGLSITLGVLGFLSGIVQLFIDVNAKISVKWLLLTWLILFSVCFILLKIIFNVLQSRRVITGQESPIKYLDREEILIIRKNESFLNNILVGCYMAEDGVEQLVLIGVVHHVQEKLIQIKVIRKLTGETPMLDIKSQLKNIIIRPVIPYSILSYIERKEDNNV
jgi:hypothetical protein